MDAGDWIALGAAVFAAAAVVFAGLSWHQSRRSANAAVRSADSSERSAQAAERSAMAEEQAAAIAKREEEARQAPKLGYTAQGRVNSRDSKITVTLIDGPPELDVTTTGLWIKNNKQDEWVGTSFSSDPTRVSVGGLHFVPVDLRSENQAVEVKVTLKCLEIHSDRPRVWDRTGVVTFRGPARVVAF